MQINNIMKYIIFINILKKYSEPGQDGDPLPFLDQRPNLTLGQTMSLNFKIIFIYFHLFLVKEK